jgi:hypothetical protein
MHEGWLIARDVKFVGGMSALFCIRQHAFVFYLGKQGEEGTVMVMCFGEMAAYLHKTVAGLQYCIAG